MGINVDCPNKETGNRLRPACSHAPRERTHAAHAHAISMEGLLSKDLVRRRASDFSQQRHLAVLAVPLYLGYRAAVKAGLIKAAPAAAPKKVERGTARDASEEWLKGMNRPDKKSN